MKKMINSAIASFAMFSRIPMPRCDWEKENIRYMLVFMPFVGAVIGGLSVVFYFLIYCGHYINDTLALILFMLIPFVTTGGIHLDGYLDTTDALSSWKPKEERVEILKDVHVGAFAVIRGIVYFIFLYGVYAGVAEKSLLVLYLGLTFFLSRCFNALSILTFPKAKAKGTVNTWQKDADPICKPVLMVLAFAGFVLGFFMDPFYGLVLAATVLGVYAWYYFKSKKYFGGMTGDLAGYFVCICEPAAMFILLLACALRTRIGI